MQNTIPAQVGYMCGPAHEQYCWVIQLAVPRAISMDWAHGIPWVASLLQNTISSGCCLLECIFPLRESTKLYPIVTTFNSTIYRCVSFLHVSGVHPIGCKNTQAAWDETVRACVCRQVYMVLGYYIVSRINCEFCGHWDHQALGIHKHTDLLQVLLLQPNVHAISNTGAASLYQLLCIL